MKPFLKKVLNAILSLVNLEVTQKRKQDEFYFFQPYIKPFEIDQIRFNYFFGSSDAAHWFDLWYPNPVKEEMEAISWVLKNPKGIILDIGAHQGLITTFLAKKYPNNDIYSFEPNPTNLVLLKANVQLNELNNVKTIEYALGSENKEVEILTKNSNSYILFHHSNNQDKLPIRIKTLDSFNLPAIDFIKIDVEGYETEVIKGASESIRKYKPILSVEIHAKPLVSYGSSVREFIDILVDLGYRFFINSELNTNRTWQNITNFEQKSERGHFLFTCTE